MDNAISGKAICEMIEILSKYSINQYQENKHRFGKVLVDRKEVKAVFNTCLKTLFGNFPHYATPYLCEDYTSDDYNSLEYRIEFGRITLISQGFPYGEVIVGISSGYENFETLGILTHDMTNASETLWALCFNAISYDGEEDSSLYILKLSAGLMMLVQALDFLGHFNLPAGAWVPKVSPEALYWLNSFGITDPSFEPTEAGRKIMRGNLNSSSDDVVS